MSVHPPTDDMGAMRLEAQEAFDIGVRCVRTDVYTSAMAGESTQKYVRRYLKTLRETGHRRLVVVMGGGLKLADVLKIRAGDLVAWRAYVVQVARAVKEAEWSRDEVVFQLLNEPNHFPQWKIYHERTALVAAAAEELVEFWGPGVSLGVNVFADADYLDYPWRRTLHDLVAAVPAVTHVGIDHYPSTWMLRSSKCWGELAQLLHDTEDPGSPLFNRTVAVFETGYSSFLPLVGERWQKNYMERIPRLLHEIGRGRIAFVNFYELMDNCDRGLLARLNPERHFGLMCSPKSGDQALTRKPAYLALAAEIRQLDEERAARRRRSARGPTGRRGRGGELVLDSPSGGPRRAHDYQ